jgi:hypothetical protein
LSFRPTGSSEVTFQAGALAGDRVGLGPDAGVELRGELLLRGGREEAELAGDRGGLLWVGEVADQVLGAVGVGGGLGDRQAGEDRDEPQPLGAGRGGEGDEVVGGALQRLDQPGLVVPGDPHLAGLERLLHERVPGRLGVGQRPGAPHPLPHGLRVGAGELGVERAGEARVGVALEEPPDEAVLGGGEAQPLGALLLLDALPPGGELLVGERVDVGAGRQRADGLLAGDHQVAGLRPRDVDGGVAADLGELQVVRVEAASRQLLGEVAQVGQQPVGGEAGHVAVLPADHRDAALAGLGLGADAVLERSQFLAEELDLASESGQHGRA